jgi:hypothetical protein
VNTRASKAVLLATALAAAGAGWVAASALAATKFVTFRVPYPLGFYTRGADFRIDDPKQDWKGKAMHATYSSKVPWHQENGDEYSKLVSFQLRPDPLAH